MSTTARNVLTIFLSIVSGLPSGVRGEEPAGANAQGVFDTERLLVIRQADQPLEGGDRYISAQEHLFKLKSSPGATIHDHRQAHEETIASLDNLLHQRDTVAGRLNKAVRAFIAMVGEERLRVAADRDVAGTSPSGSPQKNARLAALAREIRATPDPFRRKMLESDLLAEERRARLRELYVRSDAKARPGGRSPHELPLHQLEQQAVRMNRLKNVSDGEFDFYGEFRRRLARNKALFDSMASSEASSKALPWTRGQLSPFGSLEDQTRNWIELDEAVADVGNDWFDSRFNEMEGASAGDDEWDDRKEIDALLAKYGSDNQ